MKADSSSASLPDSIQERFRIPGRVAIVTGGAGLLGSHHCHTLAQAGGTVVIADTEVERAVALAEEIRDATANVAHAIHTDVTDADSVRSMVRETLEKFGQIDILVNNAAVDPKFEAQRADDYTAAFEDYPLENWQRSLQVNITGMFLCAQAVTRPMLEAGQGVMVNVSSTYGLVGPDQALYQRPDQPPQYKPVDYSVTKAAALGLTRYLATYFARQGIRVNALTPGGVLAGQDEEFIRRYSAKTVLGRMANRDEVSAALLFLVSDASSYMTGANLVVDGGWTAW